MECKNKYWLSNALLQCVEQSVIGRSPALRGHETLGLAILASHTATGCRYELLPRLSSRGSAFVLLIESLSDFVAMDWAGIEDEKITFLPSMIDFMRRVECG